MSFELKNRKQHWHFNCLIFVLLSLFLSMDAYADDPARIAPKEFDLGNFRIRSIPMTPGPGMNCPTGFWDKIEVSGEIAPETTALVEQFLKEARRCTIRNPSGKVSLDRTLVFLGSNGGFIRDGFKIGELFRNHGVFTVVRPGQTCASSCAVAFLGGNERYLSPGAKLVFHAPYYSK